MRVVMDVPETILKEDSNRVNMEFPSLASHRPLLCPPPTKCLHEALQRTDERKCARVTGSFIYLCVYRYMYSSMIDIMHLLRGKMWNNVCNFGKCMRPKARCFKTKYCSSNPKSSRAWRNYPLPANYFLSKVLTVLHIFSCLSLSYLLLPLSFLPSKQYSQDPQPHPGENQQTNSHAMGFKIMLRKNNLRYMKLNCPLQVWLKKQTLNK